MSDKIPDNARFLRLYTNIQSKLYFYVLAVIHNRQDADDIFQETVVTLWDNFDKYQEGTSFGAWAIGIAKNKVFDYLRENKKTKKLFDDSIYSQLSELAEDKQDDFVDRQETLTSCIKKLKPSDDKLLTLRYHKSASMRQMSQMTGRSCDSLYKSMARIISQLRKCMKYKRLESNG